MKQIVGLVWPANSVEIAGFLPTAHDALGEDPGCGKPLFLPVQQLGQVGRKAALRAYFKNHFSISVEQHMDYFQVGQNKAVNELKNIDWLVLENADSDGRKKEDT